MQRLRPPTELAFAVGFVCGLLTLAIFHLVLPSSADRDVELFRAVRDLTEKSYVESLDPRELLDEALAGMVGSLDPYSRYYGPDEIAGVQRETSGEYFGIGVLFLDLQTGVIRFALPDSPAERAGLTVGDQIIQIDEAFVRELPAGELRERLQRAADDPVVLRVEDRAGNRRTTTVRSEKVVDPTVRHARMVDADLGIGYLAIVSFSHQTPDEFDRWIEWLRDQGMRSLILDLRSNPGGILDSAIRIADRFIEDGVLVSTRSRTETRSTHASEEETHLAGLPLVVLVDGESASASEVLCGALQDHRVAVVAGEPTYGKGAVQTLSRFERDEAMVKITTSNYFTPAGRRIERGSRLNGLTPDVMVEIPAALRRLVRSHLHSYSPPPAALPLLEAWEAEEEIEVLARAPQDPQLDTATRLLRGESLDPRPIENVD